jgi:mRNA-degrading endonuclease HigB of HigAB toxin-antitoxin module
MRRSAKRCAADPGPKHCPASASVPALRSIVAGRCFASPGERCTASGTRSWFSAADVKRSYATASTVSADRIVFNIKGNDYRLVVATDFEKGIVWIKWIGTHKDYDKIDVKEVQHGG